MIVDCKSPLTLVGGGKLGKHDLSRARKIGGKVVAADGGANAALSQGIRPDAVIGDFDSIDDHTRTTLQADTLHYIEDQDTSDFDKCLSNIAAPLILGVGFTGARIDHQLANFNTLVRFPTRRCILLGEGDIAFLPPPSFFLDLEPGTPVSLFPFGAVEGTSEGLKWPISGLNFNPDGRIGTSNEAMGPVSLFLTSPKMLMILPETAFETAAHAILKTSARWTQQTA